MAELVLIAAMARGRVIGNGGGMPWRLPEDLAHFREATRGHTVIMGRKTWDSLPERFRPLPGRRNLVVTRQPAWQAAGAEAFPTLDAALQACASDARVFVIGGAELYATALPQADTLLLTEIDADFDGDVRFPAFEDLGFVEVARHTVRTAPPNDFALAFVTRRRPH